MRGSLPNRTQKVCTCVADLEGHWVNVESLVLLDEFERSFGSTVLKIEMIYSDNGYCLVISPQGYAVS